MGSVSLTLSALPLRPHRFWIPRVTFGGSLRQVCYHTRMNVDEREFGVIKGITKELLPKTHRAFLFGSRATGTNRPHPDYDLGVEGPRPLSPREWGALHDAFEEAPIIHEVDVVDLYPSSEEFKKEALRDAVALE